MEKRKTVVKNFCLLILSLAVLFFVIAGAFRLIVRWKIPDEEFYWEDGQGSFGFPRRILKEDPQSGYVNKADFRGFCYGTVHLATDGHGFRIAEDAGSAKRSAQKIILGLGDSVMFAPVVDDKDTFLSLLEEKLNRGPLDYEVINAGVVGYSTFQEARFLKRYLLRSRPDIVLVNYCINDLLSTEDPFANMGIIYRKYLRELRDAPREVLDQNEKKLLEKIIYVFETSPHIWSAISALSPEEKEFCLKVFIQFPLTDLISACRENEVRLIYLFIPPAYGGNWKEDWEVGRWVNLFRGHDDMVKYFRDLLRREGVEFLDFSEVLLPGGEIEPGVRMGGEGEKVNCWLRAAEKLLPRSVFLDFAKIATALGYSAAHRSRNFFDECHPTAKGNRVIAERIYDYLMSTPNQSGQSGL